MITNLDNKEYLDYSGLTLYDELIKGVINSGNTYNIDQIEEIRNYTEDSIRDIRYELNDVKADFDDEIRDINNDINSLDEKVESYNSNLKQNIDGVRTVAKSNYVKLNNLEKATANIDYRLTNAESAIAAGIESGEHIIDALPTNGNTDHLVSSDGVYMAIQASSGTKNVGKEVFISTSYVEFKSEPILDDDTVIGYKPVLSIRKVRTMFTTDGTFYEDLLTPDEGASGATYATIELFAKNTENYISGSHFLIYHCITKVTEGGQIKTSGEFYGKPRSGNNQVVLDEDEYLFGEVYFYYGTNSETGLPTQAPSLKITKLNVLSYQITGEYSSIYGFDNIPRSGSTNLLTSDTIYHRLSAITGGGFDDVPTSGSTKLVRSDGIHKAMYKEAFFPGTIELNVTNSSNVRTIDISLTSKWVYLIGGDYYNSAIEMKPEERTVSSLASGHVYSIVVEIYDEDNKKFARLVANDITAKYKTNQYVIGEVALYGQLYIKYLNSLDYRVVGDSIGLGNFDSKPTAGSSNIMTSDSINTALINWCNREAIINASAKLIVEKYENEENQTRYRLYLSFKNGSYINIIGRTPVTNVRIWDGIDTDTGKTINIDITNTEPGSYDLILKLTNDEGTYSGALANRPIGGKFHEDEFLIGRIWMNPQTGVINIIKLNTTVGCPITGDYTGILGYDNVPTSGSSKLLTSDVIFNELEKKANKDTSKPTMEVRIWGGAFGDKHKSVLLFDVRTKFNEMEDVIIRYYAYPNNFNISSRFIWIGPSDYVYVNDTDLKNNARVYYDCFDITSPMHGTRYYWAIFQQHGYNVPTWVINSTGLPFNVGDEFTGIVNGSVETNFTIGRINENTANTTTTLYLLPELGNEERDSYSRKWKHNDTITSLSGATVDITNILSSGTSSEAQIGPISENIDRKFVLDGVELTEPGIYYGNEFSASETRIGYDPGSISTWSPLADTTGAEELAKFVWTHKFFGTSCVMSSTIELKKDFEFKGYGPIQMIFPCSSASTKDMFIYPKVKGREQPFEGNNSFVLTRSESDLVDVNEIPDRIIYYTENEQETQQNKRKLGISAGFSLISGDSVKGKIEEYIPVYNPIVGDDLGRIAHFWVNKTSDITSSYYKAYQYGMNAQNFVTNEDGTLRYFWPKGFFGEFTTYYNIFDPSQNERDDLNYWYKDGDSYVLYLHSYTNSDIVEISVPPFMEGMGLSVVEKTEGSELLSSIVINGKLYVKYASEDEESLKYLVIKIYEPIVKDYTYDINETKDDISNIEERVSILEELATDISSESPYQDDNILKYVVDENNAVIAEIQKSGAVKKYAKTEEEKIAEDKLEHLSTVSEYQDPNVLKYILDEDNKCLGYIEKDGTFNFYRVKVQHKDEDDVSNNELWTVVGLLANSCDTVKMTKNKKAMSTIFNISTPKAITLNTENNNKVSLTPKISIIDDDTIDNQIPSSWGGSTVNNGLGGYFSMLLPMLLSLQEKYKDTLNGKKLVAGLACEGQRVGLTKIYSEDDSYTSLNENGECVKWIHDNLGWDVFNHSMTAQLPMETYHFERHDSEEARIALRGGYYSTKRSFYNTIMYEDSTGKWYEPADSGLTEWTERTPFAKYAMPFYFDYPGYDVVRDPETEEIETDPVTGEPIIRNKPIAPDTPAYFNREFDFGYNWGEWFKRADELGLPYERVVVHNGNTSSVYMINGSRSHADFSVRTNGTHNYPPIAASVNRISAVNGDTNAENTEYTQRLKNEVDKCISGNTWMVFMTHANEQSYFRNGYVSGVTYPRMEQNYPEQWIVPIKHDDIIAIINGAADVNTPPSALRISTWDQWHPAIGTQAYALYEVLGYAIENGVDITSPMEGWLSHGNIVNLGVDRNGQTYPYDRAENNTPYTDEELSYLTVGGDTSIRLYNHKS